MLEITSLQYGLFIAAMIVAWGFLDLLEEVDPELSGGISAPLATAVRVIPSGWGVVAVEAAGSGRWTLAIGALGGLAVLIGGGLWVWEGLLRRRVTSPRTGMAGRPRQGGRRLLPATPLGAVVGKDLRTWFRDPRRAVEVRSSLWAAVFTTAGLWILVPEVLPFAGIIVVVVGAMACVNIYAMDGTALWLTLLTPGAERADVRGRQAAWLAIFVPAALVPSALGLAVSQSAWAGPWVAAILPAILGGAAGLIPLLSVYGMVPETDAHKRSGNPAETGGDATGLYFTMFFTVPLAAGPPAALLLLAANAGESGLAWAAVAVGAVSGTVYAWWFGRLAYTRLQAQGPELLQLMRVGRRPESKPDDEATADLSWGGQALVGILVTFGMIALVPQAIIPGVMKVVGPGDPEWFIALHASQSWQWPIIAGMAGFGVLLLTGAYVIYQQGIDSTE